jgi:hypothetical protein
MKLAIAILYFIVTIQVVSYLFWAFDVFGGLIEYPLGDVSSLSSIFNIDAYSVLIGVVGAVGIGLAGILLRQGVYAIYAMLLWGFGVIFRVVQTFVLAIPNTIGALIPNSTNPFPPDAVTGAYPIHPFIVVIVFLFTFGAWWYFFGIVIQREPV